MKADDPSSKDTAGTLGKGPTLKALTKEPLVSAAGAAKNANKAINETARKYLAAAGIKVDLEDIQNRIRDTAAFLPGDRGGRGFCRRRRHGVKMGAGAARPSRAAGGR